MLLDASMKAESERRAESDAADYGDVTDIYSSVGLGEIDGMW